MIRKALLLAFLMLMMVTFSGCPLLGGKSDEAAPDEEISDMEEGGEEEVVSEEEMLFNKGPQPLVKNYRPIAVAMPDGMKIEGTLYVPGLSPYDPEAEAEEEGEAEEIEEGEEGAAPEPIAPAKVRYPLVVLFHMLSGDRWEWKDYPRHLVEAGYAVLVFDLRGHGDSVYRGKQLRVWRQFGKSDWEKMPFDLEHILEAIAKQPKLNMVDTKHLGLLGASIGANAAVNFASKYPNRVKALVLLSPGLEYHNIMTFDPLTHYENAVYFVASKEDAYAAESTQRLYKFALGKKKLQIYQDLGHGIDMLNNEPTLASNILDWLKETLPPPGAKVVDMESGDGKPSTADAPKTEEGHKPASKETPKAPAVSEKEKKAAKPASKETASKAAKPPAAETKKPVAPTPKPAAKLPAAPTAPKDPAKETLQPPVPPAQPKVDPKQPEASKPIVTPISKPEPISKPIQPTTVPLPPSAPAETPPPTPTPPAQ